MNKLIALFTIFISFSASAKWIELKDSATQTIFYNSQITVNQNGTSEEIVEFEDLILNEAGRLDAASFIKTYNANDSKVNILEAYTINNNEKHPLDLNAIEDKPLASAPHGFDQTRQILLSFPKAEIGSKIHLKYANKITETELENFYNNKFYFGFNGCWEASNRKIISKLPLNIEINDPDNVLQVTQEQKGEQYILDIKLKQPICRGVADTSETGTINSKKYTWVAVSSFKTWDEYAKKLAKKYETVINQKLPSLFLPILEAARLKQNEVDQLNLVTALVNEKMRYMGYWLSVKGQFIPRDLELIANSQEGDCKDFSAITAAIIKALGGFKVQPAFIFRGEGELSLTQNLPTSDQFNHVFLKVTNKAGKVYWVDPTNTVSMAQGIFPDIADKIIVVLDESNPSYERTPYIDSAHAQIILKQELEFKGDNIIISGGFTLKGEEAIWLTGAGLSNSENTIKDKLFYLLSGTHLTEEEKQELILPNLNSRIVNDLNLKFKYQQSNQLIKTNLGPALKINTSGVIDQIIDQVPEQLSDIYIGSTRTIKKIIILKNIKIKNIKTLNYENDSPWLYIKRSCNTNGNDSEILKTIVIKKNFITSDELKSNEYQALKSSLEKNIKNVAIVLQ